MKPKAKRRIYIEATALSRQKRTGVDYLAEGLIRPLVEKHPEVEFVFFRFREDGDELHITGKNVREVIIDRIPARVFRLLYLFGLAPNLEWLLGETPEEVIFPNFYRWPMRSRQARTYVMVPDTAFVDHPEYLSNWYHRQLLNRGVAYSARHATSLLTCSQASKKSIQKHFQVLPEDVEVLYPGYSPPKLDKTKSTTMIPEAFILFVGTLEPRKNIANLIRAYMALPEKLRKQYQLVLAGGKGWRDEEIQELITRYKSAGVLALGYVDDSTRQALYKRATLFAYPAIYEGFGMPIIEAQAHGLPILTAHNTSLPEAAGEAAVYVQVDSESIARGLQELLEDASLRKRLATAGRVHARQFTWASSVDQLQKLLDLG